MHLEVQITAYIDFHMQFLLRCNIFLLNNRHPNPMFGIFVFRSPRLYLTYLHSIFHKNSLKII